MNFFSPCFFGHDEPLKEMSGKVFRFKCPRCLADLGPVLEGQKYKARKEKKLKPKKSAAVLRLTKRA
jgi:hypothetical protein